MKTCDARESPKSREPHRRAAGGALLQAEDEFFLPKLFYFPLFFSLSIFFFFSFSKKTLKEEEKEEGRRRRRVEGQEWIRKKKEKKNLYFNLSKEKGSLSPLSFRYKKIGEKEREREEKQLEKWGRPWYCPPPSFKTEIAHPGRMCYVCLRSVSNTLTFGLCFHLVDERTTTPENQTAKRKRNREIPRPSTCNIPSLPSIAQLFNFTINNNKKTWLTSWHITTTTREDRTPCNIQHTHDVYV